MSSSDVERHNQEVLKRFRVKIAEGLQNKIKDTLVGMNIPAKMNPENNIYDSISYSIDEETGIITVGSTAPHSIYVEWGRLPDGRPPPYEPIHAWVIKKMGKSDPEAKSIAWAVVNHIAKEGIKAKRPFKIALEEFVRGV